MNKLLTALILVTATCTVQAKIVATNIEYKCYAYYVDLEKLGADYGNRQLATFGRDAARFLRNKFDMNISSIVDYQMSHKRNPTEQAKMCDPLLK